MAVGIKSPFDGTLLDVGAPPVAAASVGFVGLLDLTGLHTGRPDAGVVVQPQTGHVIATGHIPNIVSTTGSRSFPLTGHVLATGHAPTIATPNVIRPETGHVVATGYAPQVVVNTRVEPLTGHVIATGYAPGIARYAECVTFDSTFYTFDQDTLSWDLVSQCPAPVPEPEVPIVGGGRHRGDGGRQRGPGKGRPVIIVRAEAWSKVKGFTVPSIPEPPKRIIRRRPAVLPAVPAEMPSFAPVAPRKQGRSFGRVVQFTVPELPHFAVIAWEVPSVFTPITEFTEEDMMLIALTMPRR